MTERTCDFDDCNRWPEKRGLCETHYQQRRKGRELTPIKQVAEKTLACSEEGCANPRRSKGLCHIHYMRKYNEHHAAKFHCWFPGCDNTEGVKTSRSRCVDHKTTCLVDGCTKIRTRGWYCAMHTNRLNKTGELGTIESTKRNWGEGTDWFTKPDGYVVRIIRVNGRLRKIFQHRKVMEEVLGRELLSHETIHHRNGHRDDNRPENLELWAISQPAGQRVTDKTEWALRWIATYVPEALDTEYTAEHDIKPLGQEPE